MSTRYSTNGADSPWMTHALELAGRGVGLAHPNPMVGAVVVKNDRVVGEGFHVYDRRDHAEIVALNKAGENARGATLYVTLEPCCTTGRTGPCTKAIVRAGVERVVAAVIDPNPNVSGRGFAELKNAGVRTDLLSTHEAQAKELNEGFARWVRTGRPFVTLKSALTLDGQIAQRSGSTTWITSEESRDQVQRMRHAADALLTGVGTVLADDPRLTDRSGEPRRRKLLRVIVDSSLRTPVRSRIFDSADHDVLIFTVQSADSKREKALTKAGAEIVRVRAKLGGVSLPCVLDVLGKREILSVILETGADLNGAALEGGIVDKMVLFYAPKLMGKRGVPVARISNLRWFSESPALTNLTLRQFGPDFAVQGYLHDVYGDHGTRRKN
jgi:diaminohydroxyphosphoribosylaminopyrimidine deaminase / 5-amino-6-(5-phosphoribosylamino)uracil reductase